MIFRSTAILLLLTVAEVSGAPAVKITGTIVDRVSRQPVEGASIELEYAAGSNVALARKTTSKSGVFQFEIEEPGSYRIDVSADGYVSTDFRTPQAPMVVENQEFENGAPPREHSTTVAIDRSGTISGTLKDSATQKPLADFTVKAYAVKWSRGKRRFTAQQGLANTDDKGEFRLEVSPGEYIVQIWKAPAPDKFVVAREADYSPQNPAPKMYVTSFWPLGDPQTVQPLLVVPGAEASVGTLNLAKIQPGRIRSSVPPAYCPEGGKAQVSFEVDGLYDSSLRGQAALPCGRAFTLHNLTPARYKIQIMAADSAVPFGLGSAMDRAARFSVLPFGDATKPAQSAQFAEAEVQISEASDLDLNFQFERTYGITTTIDCGCAKGWEAKLASLQVDMGSQILAAPSPPGRNEFHSVAVGADPLRPSVVPAPPGYAIKLVLSNGSPTGLIFVPSPGKPEQTATIVFTDKPSSIGGVVLQNDQPVDRGYVLFAPWPLHKVDGFPAFDGVSVNSDGKFAIGHLSPGTWHVVAIGEADKGKIDMPGMAENWLAKGTELTLAEGESQEFRLEPAH